MTLTLECRAEDMRGLDLLFKLQGQTIDTTSMLTLTKPQGNLQSQTRDTTSILTYTKPQTTTIDTTSVLTQTKLKVNFMVKP